jgi:hypothetical protein
MILSIEVRFNLYAQFILQITAHDYGGTGPPEWPIKKRNQKMEKRFPKTNFLLIPTARLANAIHKLAYTYIPAKPP